MIDWKEIEQRAGTNSLDKGKDLYQSGQVSQLSKNGEVVKAQVLGHHVYQVELVLGNPMTNACTCPAAEYQDFCKHCVAVALAVHNEDKIEDGTVEDPTEKLRQFLAQKPAEELVELLLGYIESNEREWDKWQLKLQTSQGSMAVKELKKFVTKALPLRDVWEWDRVRNYFDNAEMLFEQIWDAFESLTVSEQWEITLHGLERLNKVIARIDDSGGFRFTLEGQLNEKLPTIFKQLDWPVEKKAQWLAERLDGAGLDIFPDVPADFELSEELEQSLLVLCRASFETRLQGCEVSDFKQSWPLQKLSRPILDHAERIGDWQQQVYILAKLAHRYSDYLDISELCLRYQQELDAEDWLIRAKKHSTKDHELRQCLHHEVLVRQALGENKIAWKIAWQLFTDQPNFSDYKQLAQLHQELGEPEADFLVKIESLLAGCYQDPKVGRRIYNFDAVLEFYLDLNMADKARAWAKQHKAGHGTLLKLADKIVADHPIECAALYKRVLESIIAKTNNAAYQEAIKLLVKLAGALSIHSHNSSIIEGMVAELAKEFKAKRNMMKLLREHFAHCL